MPKSNEVFNQTVELKIERLVPNGYGLGFADGLTFFVSLAAVGDQVRVKINQQKGNLAFAEIVEIIAPSSVRVTPKCKYFSICGGCDFQQMNYEAQLSAKIGIIRDCLKRIGKIDFEGEIPIIPSPQEFGYRARAQWHSDTRTKKIGYFKRNSHQIIDLENCPILTDELNRKLTDLRQNLNWDEFWAEKIEIETANSKGQISLYSAEIIEPTAELFFQTETGRYFYDAHTFFQGNPLLIEDLIKVATRDAEGKTALDLFCGVGLFALPLARKFGQVLGIESNQKSIEFARKNAEHARLSNLEFFNQNVTDCLSENNLKEVDYILLDPPRTGAEKETIEAILQLAPTQVSYVSCDPATLARDLRILRESYQIESITALDLFPQTHHVETVVRLINNRQ
jgi:23S rRNA (uracil1939-C5)-methyltransferase